MARRLISPAAATKFRAKRPQCRPVEVLVCSPWETAGFAVLSTRVICRRPHYSAERINLGSITKSLAQHAGKVGPVVGLGEQKQTRVEAPIMDNGILSIPGREPHLR